MKLAKYIKDVPNFPTRGIMFKDISPLLANGEALNQTIIQMAERAIDADIIVGPGARGFLFGTPVAAYLKKPFIMIRKPGKLPGDVISKSYDLEYGSNVLELQKGMLKKGQKVIIIDDVLATGGTTKAIINLIEDQGAIVLKLIVLLELKDLKGRKKFKDIKVVSLITV